MRWRLWILVLGMGCTRIEGAVLDLDGDGFTVAEGDCWDLPEGPPGLTLSGADIHPEASERWYDGVDQDCDGRDDYDVDADGYVPTSFVGLSTTGLASSGALPGGDCWDDPRERPTGMEPLHGLYEVDGAYAVAGEPLPEAETVNPGAATDLPYDGIDADCAGDDGDGDGSLDDFDADGDGYETSAYADRTGTIGQDCIDCDDGPACLAEANPSEAAAAAVHPGATEVWYDGTDDDCDTDDCDADGDGSPGTATGEDTDFCVSIDCDDTDPNRSPTDEPETYYNGIDDNCDLSDHDGDVDGDGYWAADYATQVADNPDALGAPLEIPEGWEGDCDDSGNARAGLNGFDDLGSDAINPAADERYYDGIDQDCLGTDADGSGADDDFDWDGDGVATLFAEDGDGALGEDCGDCELSCGDGSCAEYALVCTHEGANPGGVDPINIQPGAGETYYDGTDQDCLGVDGDGDGSEDDFDADQDGHEADTYGGDDCNDVDASINPSVNEECGTAHDDDCDGDTNDEDAADCTEFHGDTDGDGYGHQTDSECYCEATGAWAVADASDCDDADATVNPAANEVCDGQDNDCDGSMPDEESDLDGDGAVSCEEDSGGWDGASLPEFEDCDDEDDSVYPSADELCDGLDNDCDGSVPTDEADDDGDTYVECTVDADGYDASASIAGGDDCDDGDAALYPSADELCDGRFNDCADSDYSTSGAPDEETDNDGDGYVACEVDSGGWVGTATISGGEDCDDEDGEVYPGATEVCDGRFTDCDDSDYATGSAPEDETDDDGDGYVECELDSGGWDGSGSALGDDCDDDDADVNPAATEVCDDEDLDEDCSGLADDDDSGVDTSTTTTWYLDSDGDGHVSASASSVSQCDEPADPGGGAAYLTATEYSSADDCDDGDADVSPDGTEVCDAADTDEDCDGGADDADPDGDATGRTNFYEDGDGDGYGADSGSATEFCDSPASGYSSSSDDCDDSDGDINPGASEVCDASDVDEDCDGEADDDDPDGATGTNTLYVDADDDGYGDDGDSGTEYCDAVSGYVADASDCDDDDDEIHPGAAEVCDEVDNDCNGDTDDDDSGLDTSSATTWYFDDDGDGYGDPAFDELACEQPSGYAEAARDCDDTDADVNPGEDEVCDDGINNDCDSDSVCRVADEFAHGSVVFEGGSSGDELGSTVLLFDADGDGQDDMILGAPEAADSGSDKGDVYVVLGPTSASSPSISGGSSTQATRTMSSSSDYDARLSGASNNMRLGGSLADAGSQDGDGYADLLVGAAYGDIDASNAGDVYLFLGPVTSDLSTSSADLTISGQQAGALLGFSLVGGIDFAGSGAGLDFLLGERGDSTTSPDAGETGAAYLFYGGLSTGSLDTSDADITFTGEAADDAFGHASAAGDVDGDGLTDVIVSSPYADPDSASAAGSAYLFAGDASSSGSIAASAADAVFEGQSANDRAGWAVRLLEVSGDGYADIVVGADGDDDGGSSSGVTYVVYGSASVSDTPLSSTDAVIVGTESSDRSGTSIAGGDVDGDSFGDLLVGAYYADNNVGTNVSNAGAVAVFYGPVSGTLDFDGGDALVAGESSSDLAGYHLAVGEVDGDDYAEMLVGAPQADPNGDSSAGSAYLLLGVGE